MNKFTVISWAKKHQLLSLCKLIWLSFLKSVTTRFIIKTCRTNYSNKTVDVFCFKFGDLVNLW